MYRIRNKTCIYNSSTAFVFNVKIIQFRRIQIQSFDLKKKNKNKETNIELHTYIFCTDLFVRSFILENVLICIEKLHDLHDRLQQN